MDGVRTNLLRYPGGKQRILRYIKPHLPVRDYIEGRFVEPFVGGGAVFFELNPRNALLADINVELIDLYRGIRRFPHKVWRIFKEFPTSKKAYYRIRSAKLAERDLASRAARTLYLNRTCFKGMWRHNANGEFNVGYGGRDRLRVINEECIFEASKRLRSAILKCCDFESVINSCLRGDFIFVDPPYRPGESEITHSHYVFKQFSYGDHQRLAFTLKKATDRGVDWAMTTSSHPNILRLFEGNKVILLPKGTGRSPGMLTNNSGEVLIWNYQEVFQ